MEDYYRIVIENGKVKINIFEKNNPIPYNTIKADITKQKGKELLALLLQKYGMNLEDFKKAEEKNKEEIKNDIAKFINEEE